MLFDRGMTRKLHWLGLALTGAAGWFAGAAQAQDAATCYADCTPRVAIMAAFGQEADLLHHNLVEPIAHRINGVPYTTGLLENIPVVLVTSGIGLPNAVMTTQILVDHFAIDSLLFTGIAGGVSPEHEVGDVIVARNWAFHQEGYHANSADAPQPCGTPGELACLGLQLADQIPSFGAYHPRLTNVVDAATGATVALRDPFTQQPVAYGAMVFDYPVDPVMYQVAQTAFSSIKAGLEPICPEGGSCIQPEVVAAQRCVTGSNFLANSDYRQYLAESLGVACVDMETTGAAHVARANSLPYLAFRSLSDLAGDDGHPEAVGAFFSSGVAQRNAARVTLDFLRAWQPHRAGLPAR